MPLIDVTLSEIKQWRASLDPATEATNVAAYRLIRSLAPGGRREEELIFTAPPRSAAPARRG